MLSADIVVTGCQVEPPSADTSTPATTPPPESVAVPLIVTVLPLLRVAPADGEVIVEVGGAVSAGAVPATRPDISVAGCAPISASRLTVACCMAGSVGVCVPVVIVVKPHAH